MDEHVALKEAIQAAKWSPCQKSKRGVVVWHAQTGSFVVGFNHQPWPFSCTGSEACREHCSKLCLHAEEVVLLHPHCPQVLRGDRMWWNMLHVEVVEGEAVASGPPSCWQCSRKIVNAKIPWMWLLHDDGLRRYDAREFHRLTLEHHGLPVHEESLGDGGAVGDGPAPETPPNSV